MPLLSYIYLLSEVAVMIVGGTLYKRLPRALRILTGLILFNVIETAFEWLFASFSIRNLWMSHVNTLVEFVLIMVLYSFWLRTPFIRRILPLCFIMFVSIWIVSKFTFEPFTQLDSWTATISKFIQIFFSVVILVDVVKGVDIVWTNDHRFWVTAGIVIYSAGSMFMFALFNKMLVLSPDYLKVVWSLNWVLLILSNLLYIRGYLCKS